MRQRTGKVDKLDPAKRLNLTLDWLCFIYVKTDSLSRLSKRRGGRYSIPAVGRRSCFGVMNNASCATPHWASPGQRWYQALKWIFMRLRHGIISEELRRCLKTKASVSLWRHAAIVISRRHLPQGCQFRQDYGIDEKNAIMDLQTAHTSLMAGSCYARNIREAHGILASIGAEYRQLSRSWHTRLGFGVPPPPRNESEEPSRKPIVEARTQEATQGHVNGHKRVREELERELNDWTWEEAVLRVKRPRLQHVLRSNRKKDPFETIIYNLV
jgi:hypothetical protein